MKKILILVVCMMLTLSIGGCRRAIEEEPLEETPQAVDYPYNEIEAGNIEGLEVYQHGEQTPIIDDIMTIEEIATYIREAEYVRLLNEDEEVNTDRGILIYLRDEILDSRQILIYVAENNSQLFIGTEGQVFEIESEDLVGFIEEHFNGPLLIVEERALKEGARDWFAQFQQEKGAYVYQHPDATYIKITSDERPTGGYNIRVRGFNENVYPKEITIEIEEPDPDAMVTQAITFPTVYLKVASEEATQYSVKTIEGEEYEVEDILIFSKLEMPEENDEIDSPVRVKGKIIAFEGSFVVRVLDEEESLIHEAILQADAGGPAWGNFDEEIDFSEPTTKTGSIELGEYSAEDGSYILREKIEIRFK
ncbi:Gmad2 immunoglobulin-like domain-containing protein [Alkaliphilus transvaalensis]|uniref:Gmad2 immunoglobulin-like domain-containing protein n=1 Tax=Alkaliphilus transvaalensis TaxID=114628 RepID=UPI00047AEEF5|nr:Gmad2 immunoglobulin-like domain-containing protein [Alkaliphilus transvaalensis]